LGITDTLNHGNPSAASGNAQCTCTFRGIEIVEDDISIEETFYHSEDDASLGIES
jgi:hypothetical protein